MKATILAYRGSYKQQNPKHMLVKVESINTKDAAKKLVGRIVTWTTPSGKKISGKISAPHGNLGAVRVIFAEKGLPGQALGSEVDVE